MADGTPKGKLETLHSSLVEEGYDLPDYKTFAKDMEDSNKLSKLYTNLKSDGYELPDKFEIFQVDMFGGTNPAEKKKRYGETRYGITCGRYFFGLTID